MKVLKIIILDFFIVVIVMFFYSSYVSNKEIGTEYTTLATAGGWFLILFFNFIAYTLSIITNFCLKNITFIRILYSNKFLVGLFIIYFFLIKSSFETKEIDTFFMVLSLLGGGILQLFVIYFHEIKKVVLKIITYVENLGW